MDVDPIDEVWIVTIDAPRLDDFDVEFDDVDDAHSFVQFMTEAFSWNKKFKLWLTEPEGASDLQWG
jgi:hypothetical protein